MKAKTSGLSDKVGLPWFTYHPDPLATGSVEASGARCVFFVSERWYIYTASVYTAEKLAGQICPWCIADGAAAARFGATYSDDHALIQAGVPEAVIEEVTQRTPGYHSWQGEAWKCCCGDACEFRGQPGREHLLTLDRSALEQFLSLTHWTPEQWTEFVADVYTPGSSPAIYQFACRNCNEKKYGWDSE